MKKTHESITGKGSALAKYQQVMVGEASLLSLLYYEICQLLVYIPGAVGMLLRKIFWPKMFRKCGRGTVFGAGVVVRHPGKISLGENVVISEHCVLDGRHSDDIEAIAIGDNTIMSNNVMLSCKNGRISVGANVGINAQSIIQSTFGNGVTIGNDCVIGQRCFLIGGGNYHVENPEGLIREQEILDDGGVEVETNVWLGAHVTVLGGVKIGQGSIGAAGSVISKSVEPFSVCMGVPARVVRNRR